MKKNIVVKNNYEFQKIIKEGACIKNNEFIIYYMNNSLEKNRYGISVSKKLGNAVLRNHFKRIIRNICDKNNFIYSKSKDYIIIIRKGCIDLCYNDIDKSFAYLIKKIENKEKESTYEKKN